MALDPDTTPFDNAEPGSDLYRYANYVKRPAAEALNAGEAVTVDTNGEFAKVAANGSDPVAGVAYISADAGEMVTVKTNGGVLARIDADSSADTVAAGDTCGSHDGTTTNFSHQAGELSPKGDEYFAVRVKTATDSDGNTHDYAEVLKR